MLKKSILLCLVALSLVFTAQLVVPPNQAFAMTPALKFFGTTYKSVDPDHEGIVTATATINNNSGSDFQNPLSSSPNSIVATTTRPIAIDVAISTTVQPANLLTAPLNLLTSTTTRPIAIDVAISTTTQLGTVNSTGFGGLKIKAFLAEAEVITIKNNVTRAVAEAVATPAISTTTATSTTSQVPTTTSKPTATATPIPTTTSPPPAPSTTAAPTPKPSPTIPPLPLVYQVGNVSQYDLSQYTDVGQFRAWQGNLCSAASITSVMVAYGVPVKLGDTVNMMAGLGIINSWEGLTDNNGFIAVAHKFNLQANIDRNPNLDSHLLSILTQAQHHVPVIVNVWDRGHYPRGHFLVLYQLNNNGTVGVMNPDWYDGNPPGLQTWPIETLKTMFQYTQLSVTFNR